MIPRVFVSSTVRDLLHLRDIVRDTLNDIAYIPVMGEHGDFGFHPHLSAVDSCYTAASECEFAIVIIGKRYNPQKDGVSVTHKEFRTIREMKIPHITLIEKETLAFKKVFDENPNPETLAFPGLDAPQATFGFIDEVTTSPVNNGFVVFEHTTDVRNHLKRQFANIFGNLIKTGGPEFRADIKDILAEILQLRQNVSGHQEKKQEFQRYSHVIRLLVGDFNNQYRLILETLFPSFADALEAVVSNRDLDNVVRKSGHSLEVKKGFTHHGVRGPGGSCQAFELDWVEEEKSMAEWGLFADRKALVLNQTAYSKYNSLQERIFEKFSTDETKD